MIPRLRADEACYILTFVAIPTSYHYSDLPTYLPYALILEQRGRR